MLQFSLWILVQLLCLIIRADANVKADDGPTESECRPYIEKALHELHPKSADAVNESPENINLTDEISSENTLGDTKANSEEDPVSNEPDIDIPKEEDAETEEAESQLSVEEPAQTNAEIVENETEKTVSSEKDASTENETVDNSAETASAGEESVEIADEGSVNDAEDASDADNTMESAEPEEDNASEDESSDKNLEEQAPSHEEADESSEGNENDNASEVKPSSNEKPENESSELTSQENTSTPEDTPSLSSEKDDLDDQPKNADTNENVDTSSAENHDNESKSAEETANEEKNSNELPDDAENASKSQQDEDDDTTDTPNDQPETEIPEDELLSSEVPDYELRDRSHISEILHLEDESKDKIINGVAEIILRDLKRIYENSIKPLELLYKYRDLSNRHFGDAEIFAKPLILFMGPWSAGKSTIINYLTGNENTEHSLRSGAEPSPAYFNIIMYGEEVEVLGGTQLIADWTFSGLQKFGQGLEERLHGLKLPNDLLKKVNIVEIPGILEVRKQVSRQFPFNDACQWFIDRADMIFLVYDPAKLDVGLETEAILDQLKGREYSTRIILNKADKVKPDELLRVQSALMWNISPLMSSTQPPVIYTASLWSHVFEPGAPTRLLQAQEKALLKDVRSAIDKRIENKIASARRFAVRVRNHAKMVDCYLTTYYNHKSLFGNKKRIADQIIENPQNYHIYQGLSTLTNISRYDLPDPEIYREFFHLHPLFEFKKLSETCTYFRGCPINKLDFAIAYDLPDLVGKYKRDIGSAFAKSEIPGLS